MFTAKGEVFPRTIHPPVLNIVEGKSSDFQRTDGQVRSIDMKRHSATISQEMKDGKGLSLDGFKEKAAELGRAMGKQMMQMHGMRFLNILT